jgi:type I restriction enzyme S subunit
VVNKGSILIVTRVGVGKVAIAPCDIAFSQDTTALIPNTNLVHTNFLLYALNWTIPIMLRYNQGTSINGVTRKDLRRHRLLLPSMNEQKGIAEILHACDIEIDLHVKTLTSLRQQKKGLMQYLLTGEVRVVVET